MGNRQQVRQDLGSYARQARVRSRAYRTLLQVLIAGVASAWIGWWALAWIACIQLIERIVEPLLAQHIIAPLAAKNPRHAEFATAAVRALSASAYALGWAPAWAIGGDAAGFFAGAMLVSAFVNALVYFSNSRLVFAAAIAPPLFAGLCVPALSHGLSGLHLLVLPILLVVLLRTLLAQRDQIALFESVNRNRAARAEAEEANRAKSQFMATITHELRTPLNAIINYAEMLEEELAEDRAALASDAARIRRSGKGLLGLIDNVLDYSRIESGDLRMVAAPTDVRAVLDASLAAAASLAAGCNNTLTAQLGAELDRAMIDQRLLNECVAALLSNACRFTRDGRVCLAARYVAAPGGRMLEISIDDTGCGITNEQKARLFEPFSQADAAFTRKHDGFGLGLAITRRLARLMEGDVTVSSEAGVGSRFVLTVKCEPVGAPAGLRQAAA